MCPPVRSARWGGPSPSSRTGTPQGAKLVAELYPMDRVGWGPWASPALQGVGKSTMIGALAQGDASTAIAG